MKFVPQSPAERGQGLSGGRKQFTKFRHSAEKFMRAPHCRCGQSFLRNIEINSLIPCEEANFLIDDASSECGNPGFCRSLPRDARDRQVLDQG